MKQRNKAKNKSKVKKIFFRPIKQENLKKPQTHFKIRRKQQIKTPNISTESSLNPTQTKTTNQPKLQTSTKQTTEKITTTIDEISETNNKLFDLVKSEGDPNLLSLLHQANSNLLDVAVKNANPENLKILLSFQQREFDNQNEVVLTS